MEVGKGAGGLLSRANIHNRTLKRFVVGGCLGYSAVSCHRRTPASSFGERIYTLI